MNYTELKTNIEDITENTFTDDQLAMFTFDDDSFIVGPTPDSGYTMELHYGYYPESIVTAGTTWLGEEFDSALLNGALVEALRFMKGEPDLVQMYERMYVQSLKLLKNLGDGKLRSDTYRSGQPQIPVT
ncbi:MAG: hypothetical protein EBV86_08405 [Marivivens sp.]|nr:hypothetical protein [Marivivens sp.]